MGYVMRDVPEMRDVVRMLFYAAPRCVTETGLLDCRIFGLMGVAGYNRESRLVKGSQDQSNPKK
jgi:hypothetical protein